MKKETRSKAKKAIRAGALTGARSISAVRAIAKKEDYRFERWIAAAAFAEIVADKLPFMPSRLRPGSLAGRAVLGGIAGGLVSGRRYAALGSVLGCVSAVAAAYALSKLRTQLSERFRVPQAISGALEDALVSRGARAL